MTSFGNTASTTGGSLSTKTGHQFVASASFPWKDSINGPRVQDCTVTLALQTKVRDCALGCQLPVLITAQTMDDQKYLIIEGRIKLNSHSHTTAERFKLETYEIIARVLHGKSDPSQGLVPHAVMGKSMSPESMPEYAPTSQETQISSFTLNPSASSLGQFQFITSTCRTHMGKSVVADLQLPVEASSGTVWQRKVEDPNERRFGSFLGTFSTQFCDCVNSEHGCTPEDPTSLSITVKACLSDSSTGTSSKPLTQIVTIHYPDWPELNNKTYGGQLIHNTYDTDFSGPDVTVTSSRKAPITNRHIACDITFTMDIIRTWGSGFKGRVITSDLPSTKFYIHILFN